MNPIKPSVLIIGDIMLDHQRIIKVRNIANEAPIPVYKVISETMSLGGCGNVLKNIHALGCSSLHILSAIGNDVHGENVQKEIKKLGIISHIKVIDSYQTIIKERSFCENKLMFRCDYEIQNDTIKDMDWISDVKTILDTYSIQSIILSDYNKGVLTPNTCHEIIQLARSKGIFTCVDPKVNLDKYKGCSLIKPNFNEACSLLHVPKTTPLLKLHQLLFEHVECNYSVITLAENGISLYNGQELFHELPPVKHNIIDVTGAGDIICSFMGYYLWQNNIDIHSILRMSTRIATRSVEYAGTYTIQPYDIFRSDLQHRRIITIDDLPILRHIHQDNKIVFTNGCFDIIHHGHIHVFEFSKKQGDILVVGLNSDSSIKRLKGDERPINNIDLRIKVIESIRSVDYVIVFEEDTPIEIITQLQPDILVKGGDYSIDSIIGKDLVKETILCPLVPDISSTSIIKKIKK